MKFKIEAACGCNTGRRRNNNEDNFCFNQLILPLENDGLKSTIAIDMPLKGEQIYGVFDGMGGESYGEEASYLAALTAKECEKHSAGFFYSPKRYLKDLIEKMNEAVCARSKDLDSGRMGSTAVMAYLRGKSLYICNVGDSKAFCLRGGEFLQISEDHTDEKFLAEQRITNRKPRLTQHLGIWPDEMMIEPYIVEKRMYPGDQYLLCSDGLTDMVNYEEICAIMKKHPDSPSCADALVEKALENGGKDNVTVIVIRIKELY